MVNESLVAKMRELGFTANEAKAYLTLLRNNPATRYELSKSSGIPRSAIYDIISRLEHFGAVSAIFSEPEQYIPLPPEQLLTMLEKRFSASLNDLKKKLKDHEGNIETGNIYNISGYDNLLIRAQEMINSAKQTIYLSAWETEIKHLIGDLSKAEDRGVSVVLFSFTELKSRVKNTFSYHIPEKELAKVWTPRLILMTDSHELLLGDPKKSDVTKGVWTTNQAMVAVAYDTMTLDLTLYSARKGINLEAIMPENGQLSYTNVDDLIKRFNPDIVEANAAIFEATQR
jgi:sugar-specific transcriptional regulator TrmB